MKYSFTTKAKERVEIERTLITAKVKVRVDGKEIGASHKGTRGATGTYYPLKSGTIEVRSGFFELVPRVWYNEDWVELTPPVKNWHYIIAGMPLALAVPFGLGLIPWIVALIAFIINFIVLKSQRPAGTRVVLCLLMTLLTFALIYFIIPFAATMLASPQ